MNAKRNRCMKGSCQLHGANSAASISGSAVISALSWSANPTAPSSTASAPAKLGRVAPVRACLRSSSPRFRNVHLSREADRAVVLGVAAASVCSVAASTFPSLHLSSWPNKPFVVTTQRLAPLGSRGACAAVAPQRRR
jgi:hypothetical protein